MNQLKSTYNSPFKDSHPQPIHIRFLIIASRSNVGGKHICFSMCQKICLTQPIVYVPVFRNGWVCLTLGVGVPLVAIVPGKDDVLS